MRLIDKVYFSKCMLYNSVESSQRNTKQNKNKREWANKFILVTQKKLILLEYEDSGSAGDISNRNGIKSNVRKVEWEINTVDLNSFVIDKTPKDNRLDNINEEVIKTLPSGEWHVVVVMVASPKNPRLSSNSPSKKRNILNSSHKQSKTTNSDDLTAGRISCVMFAARDKKHAVQCMRSLHCSKVMWNLSLKHDLMNRQHDATRKVMYEWIDRYVSECAESIQIDRKTIEIDAKRMLPHLYQQMPDIHTIIISDISNTSLADESYIHESLRSVNRHQISSIVIRRVQTKVTSGGFSSWFSTIGHQACLKELLLDGLDLEDEDLRDMHLLWYLTPRLSSLGLRNMKGIVGEYHISDFLSGLSALRFLESLDFSRNRVSYMNMCSIVEVMMSVESFRVEKVDVSYNSLSLDEMRMVYEMYISSAKSRMVMVKFDPFVPSEFRVCMERRYQEEEKEADEEYIDTDILRLDSMKKDSLLSGGMSGGEMKMVTALAEVSEQEDEKDEEELMLERIKRKLEEDQKEQMYSMLKPMLVSGTDIDDAAMMEVCRYSEIDVLGDEVLEKEQVSILEAWVRERVKRLCDDEDVGGCMYMVDIMRRTGMFKALDVDLDLKRRMMKRVGMMKGFEEELAKVLNMVGDAKQLNEKLDKLCWESIQYNIRGKAVDVLLVLREKRNEVVRGLWMNNVGEYEVQLEMLEKEPFALLEHNKEHRDRSARETNQENEMGKHESLVDYEAITKMERKELIGIVERGFDRDNKFELHRYRRASYLLSEPAVELFKLYRIDGLLSQCRILLRFRWRESGERVRSMEAKREDLCKSIAVQCPGSYDTYFRCKSFEEVMEIATDYANINGYESAMSVCRELLHPRCIFSKKFTADSNRIQGFMDCIQMKHSSLLIPDSLLESCISYPQRAVCFLQDLVYLLTQASHDPLPQHILDSAMQISIICLRDTELVSYIYDVMNESEHHAKCLKMMMCMVSYEYDDYDRFSLEARLLRSVKWEEVARIGVVVRVENVREDIQVEVGMFDMVRDLMVKVQEEVALHEYRNVDVDRCWLFLEFDDDRYDLPLSFDDFGYKIKKILEINRCCGVKCRLLYRYRVWSYSNRSKDVKYRMKRLVLYNKIYSKQSLDYQSMLKLYKILNEEEETEDDASDTELEMREFKSYIEKSAPPSSKQSIYMAIRALVDQEEDLYDILRVVPLAHGNNYKYITRGMKQESGVLSISSSGLQMLPSLDFSKSIRHIAYRDIIEVTHDGSSIMIEYMRDSSRGDTVHLHSKSGADMMYDIASYIHMNIRMDRRAYYAYEYVQRMVKGTNDLCRLVYCGESHGEDLRVDECAREFREFVEKRKPLKDGLKFPFQEEYHREVLDQRDQFNSHRTYSYIYYKSNLEMTEGEEEEEMGDESRREKKKSQQGAGADVHENRVKTKRDHMDLIESESEDEEEAGDLVEINVNFNSKVNLQGSTRDEKPLSNKIRKSISDKGLEKMTNSQVMQISISSALKSFPSFLKKQT